LYIPSALNWRKMEADGYRGAREFTAWTQHVRQNWSQLRILEKKAETRGLIQFGQTLKVEVVLHLGPLSPKDLAVDIYYGRVDSKAEFLDRETISLGDVIQRDNTTVFRGEIPCQKVGRFGFRVRVLPSHPLLSNPYSLGLILWG
jgi:starch phosphorylase